MTSPAFCIQVNMDLFLMRNNLNKNAGNVLTGIHIINKIKIMVAENTKFYQVGLTEVLNRITVFYKSSILSPT